MTGLGVVIQRLALVASLWCILLNALSPNTKTFITLFAIHPLFSPSSLFTSPPTPPSRATKAIKPPRREEEPESAPKPPSIALFICFVVAHTIARHVPDVVGTQQKPAVSDGRGIKESFDIIPIPDPPSDEGSLRKPAVSDGRGIDEPSDIIPPNPPSDEESLRKPAATGGRGIEESSDVSTATINEYTYNETNVDTDGTRVDKKLNRDNEQIISNKVEGADTAATNIHAIEETAALAVLYVLDVAEKTDDERLLFLARRIRAQRIQHVTAEATRRDLIEETSVEPAGVQTEASPERVETENDERGDDAEFEKSIEVDEDIKVDNEVKESIEVEDVPEVQDEQDIKDKVADECATADITSNAKAERRTDLEGLEDDIKETEDIKEEREMMDNEDNTKDEVTDDDCVTDGVVSDAELEIESEELDEDATESREMTAGKFKDVQEVKPKEDASWDAYEDDDAGDWFTIRKGKAVKISSCPVPPPVPVPPKPQAIPSQRGCIIVPAPNPKWLEEKAERHRKAVEAWNALNETRMAAERAKMEEEERKAREVQEAKATRFASFDTTMGRLDELRKAAKEERQKREQKEEENEKTIKGIDSAQNRIGNMIDMEKVRAMFDPEILKTSSFSAVVSQERPIPGPEIAPSSSSIKYTDNASVDNACTLQQNAANRPGPPQVLPSNGVRHMPAKTIEETASVEEPSALQQNAADRSGSPLVLPSDCGVRRGTTGTKRTIERRLRRRRNELRRLDVEASLTSNDGGCGESPQRDGA